MKKKKIRLSDEIISIICNLFQKIFLKEDELWIFGSRIDLNSKGGDIDLYIETNLIDSDIIAERKVKFLYELKNKIGDQNIDLIINVRSLDFELPIYNIAKSEGVRII